MGLDSINLSLYATDKSEKTGKISDKKIIWFSEKIIEMDIKSMFTKEPILQNQNHYFFERYKISPNEYIKFQNEINVRNVWRRVHEPV